jgi:hypothetical protein
LASYFDRTYDLILKSARSFQTFIVEYFNVALEKNFHEDFETIEHIKLDRLPKIDEVVLPFLFEQ